MRSQSRFGKTVAHKPLDNTQAYDYACRLLLARRYSADEMRRRLIRRGDPDPEATVKRLREQSLIDDLALAEEFVRNCLQYRAYGYWLVFRKLMARKIDRGLAERVMRAYFTPEAEAEVAHRASRTLVRQGRRERAQLQRSLVSRGFRVDAIRAAIKF